MSYVSLSFYILVIATLIVYYLAPSKARWIILLVANGAFYYMAMSRKLDAIVFGMSILVSYYGGRVIHSMKQQEKDVKLIKLLLALFIVVSAGPLFVSKIGDFMLGAFVGEKHINWIIPLGLSYYSMSIIAYLADIYWEKIEPQKNLFKYALFVSFFPLIIQGPISRYNQLGDQLTEGHSFDQENLMKGIQLVIWGFFLKFMIAEKSAVFSNQIFDNYRQYNGIFVIIGVCFYTLRLYTDFLACVTISQGVAQMFGIDIIDNFERPFCAESIKDFWRRWHISLSFWLRDYIYIPLGGNKKGKLRKYINLLITFGVSGLWHGASWRYVIWGLAHACFQIVGELLMKPRNWLGDCLALKKGTFLRTLLDRIGTAVLVILAFVMFGAESLRAGAMIIKSMFEAFNPWCLFDKSIYLVGLSQKEFTVLGLSVLLMLIVSTMQEKGIAIREWFAKQNLIVRWVIYLCAIWSIWIFGTYGFGFNAADFLYGGF